MRPRAASGEGIKDRQRLPFKIIDAAILKVIEPLFANQNKDGEEETDTLGPKYGEIIRYIRKEGLVIFQAEKKSGDGYSRYGTPVFKWAAGRPWKDFIDIAKKRGVTMIVAGVKVFTDNDLKIIKTLERASEGQDGANNGEDDRGQSILSSSSVDSNEHLSKRVGKIGSFTFLWVAGSCVFSLSESAGWYKAVAAYFSDGADDGHECDIATLPTASSAYPKTGDGHSHHCCYCSHYKPERVGLPKSVRESTIEDLAQEYVEYIKSHSTDLGYGMQTYIRDMFWEEKGLERNALSSAARYLLKSVELEVSKKLQTERQEQENERMPALVEECVKWCKEHGVSKLTVTILGTFMSAKRIRLSVNSKDVLFLKVSSRLAPSSVREGPL